MYVYFFQRGSFCAPCTFGLTKAHVPVHLWLCCRPWWRDLEIDNQDHRGQSVLFQREDARSRGNGQCDYHRDQAGVGTSQGA